VEVRLYFAKSELPALTTLSETAIDEEIRKGQFPKPRQIGGRRVGYFIDDILEWARSRPVSDQPPPANTGAKKPRAPTGTAAPVAPGAHQAA
jgi:prophage regulatory protein